MYIPRFNEETDLDTLVALMRRHHFATLITVREGEPQLTQLPFIIEHEADQITLYAHLARANPQWHDFGDHSAQVLFQGPHAYISPSLYDSEVGVPTWNYALVVAHGTLEIVAEQQAIESVMETLIHTVEPSYRERFDTLPKKYRDGMMKGIVTFRMKVERLEGKFKLSQNKTEAEQERIAAWLMEGEDSVRSEVGEMMKGRGGRG